MAERRRIRNGKKVKSKTKTVKKRPVKKRVVKKKTPRRKSPARQSAKKTSLIRLRKFAENPVIEPSGNEWESRATFNPAAVYADGRIHVLYRAIGDGDISVLGYASSLDGLCFDMRHGEPAYVPEIDSAKTASMRKEAAPIRYFSGGGGWGGAEDPRMVVIDGKVYMTFLAFNGWNSARIALTSISLDGFLRGRWSWGKPTLISPEGEVHKNWVLFPEKINGKYAILHSISPDILVDYFDSLDNLEFKNIQSAHSSFGRENDWDNLMRGAGPPPIKTKYGWLLLYHAMDRRDPDRYKLGAMILDAENPARVLYRASNPILEPDEVYENDGHKPGVIYCCGAVAVGSRLYVYYGGADTVVCVATADLPVFLENIVRGNAVKLKVEGAGRRKL